MTDATSPVNADSSSWRLAPPFVNEEIDQCEQ